MRVIGSERLRRARHRLEGWATRERPERRRSRWLPRPTVRLRLTLLYGSLFLVAGALLLGITYGLASEHQSDTANVEVLMHAAAGKGNVATSVVPPGAVFFGRTSGSGTVPLPGGGASPTAQQIKRIAGVQTRVDRKSQLSSLLLESAIALAIMSLVSILLGWLVAGRVLGPVRTMNTRMRLISEHNLHERLALGGRDDELKELGETFDDLLGRLELAFESQRRFVANASHELRTPVTVERTLVEVALADPDATVESLRETCNRVLVAGQQQERTIEALLTLARGQRGLQIREPIDLAVLGAEALGSVEHCDLLRKGQFAPASVSGDPGLVERLVANLLDNAAHYNVPGGWIRVSTSVGPDGRALLSVANSGPVVALEEAEQLREPFRRGNGERTGHGEGVGLGLSIVDAIATAHGADVTLVAQPAGGLAVTVVFPRPGRVASSQLPTLNGDVTVNGRDRSAGRADR
jgi:signal transduction histidine kinase